jgi:hypothetical protein
MAGGIVLVLAMAIAVPVGVMMTGAIWSAAFSWSFDDDSEPDSSSASH